ncbi:MAG: hypothetical protein ACK4KT_04465 [Thermaurantimonas sp.]
MKTNTSNSVKWLRGAFLILTLLSLLELAGAPFIGLNILWGYSFWIVTAIIILTYSLLGRPYFRMDTTSDILEFENGFSMFDLLDKYLIVRKDKVYNLSVEERMFRRVLVVQYEEHGELLEITFEISFLSESQVADIKNDIQRIKGNNVLTNLKSVA